jgi:hypothetical protein
VGVVAYAYNLSYSGSRDQENCGSRSAWEKSSNDLISINKSWMSWCMPVIPDGKHKQKDQGPGWPSHKCETLFEKYLQQKWLGVGLKQKITCLASALSLNSSTKKRKEEKKKRTR